MTEPDARRARKRASAPTIQSGGEPIVHANIRC